jgi:cytochrome b561|tara:strand:- start:440 stop:628 length:189 start_codon:yes stop_codon:yes gene_type:complete
MPKNIHAAGETATFNTEDYETAKWLHRMLAYLCSALVALHITAALKHHFVDKDNSLRKMLGT